MSDLFFCIQTNKSSRLDEDAVLNSFTNQSTTHPQHQQVSQTIFLCVNDRKTYDNDLNIEVIDISDDDAEEEEDKNRYKNETSIDDFRDEDKIEVIQLSDDDDEEVNDESSGDDDDEIYRLNTSEEPLDLTNKTNQSTHLQRPQSTVFEHSSGQSTSQTVHQPLLCPGEKEGNNAIEAASLDRALTTLGLYCCECSELIDTRPKLKQHWMDVHGKLPFTCFNRGCNGQFLNRSLLKKHYADHRKNQTKWICSAVDCQFESSTVTSLTAHVHQYHEKGLFLCSLCLVQYSNRKKVYNHYNTIHKYPQNIAEQIFSCPVESCQFVSRGCSDLKRHQLIHTQLRQFRCTWSDCGYATNYRWNAIRHIRAKHLHIPITKKKAD